jgi:hypothetical protein
MGKAKQHKLWLETDEHEGGRGRFNAVKADLSYADLSYADLS